MMAKSLRRRGWLWLYDVYGVEDGSLVVGLVAQAAVTGLGTGMLVCYFGRLVAALASLVPVLPAQMWSVLVGFAMGLMGLFALCFLVTACNLLHTSVLLCYRTSHEMLGLVKDWSRIDTALDVGCGRGMLLNAVALRLKKEGGGGRVVGVDLWLQGGRNARRSMAATLKTSSKEGTQEYVTCKMGDARHLPFNDDYFDLVVSGLHLSTLGTGGAAKAAPAERWKGILEIVRVLKPGGQAVIWDLHHVPEYEKRFQELGMLDIRVSQGITAYMLPSHIISVKKPG